MFSLTQLLPYDLASKKNGAFRSSFKEYKTLVRASLQAVHAVQSKNYEKFDSLVGENACEIRAIWLCQHFSGEASSHSHLKDKLIRVLDQIEICLEPSTLNRLMRSEQSFQEAVEENSLNVSLSHTDFMLVVSFLLSEMKVVKFQEGYISTIFRLENAAAKHLQRYGDVSTSFGLNLINKLRKMLAKASVQFVQEQTLAMQDPLLTAMVSDAFTVSHNGLTCIPMFWACKIVFSVAQHNQIPIIVHAKFLKKSGEGYIQVDEEKLLYQVGADGAYEAVYPGLADLDRAACVVQGIACIDEDSWSKSGWVASMSGKSVIDVILAGAADHRQYPDPALDQMFAHIEDGDYAMYKQRALKEGFAAENPSTFFIQHVYAALASKILCSDGFEASSSQEASMDALETAGALL